ncbi:MAG: DUF397 domain-containing protein [Actinophytocola sp.]|uniref:DUF397 domain-containing protein n=1 Tax=Actinophytocola sp. TaxID=1872138 RepID=UPI003C795096
MLASELPGARWRKSSRTNGANNCVEIAHVPEAVAIRDSKQPTGAVLLLANAAWDRFRASAKRYDSDML